MKPEVLKRLMLGRVTRKEVLRLIRVCTREAFDKEPAEVLEEIMLEVTRLEELRKEITTASASETPGPQAYAE